MRISAYSARTSLLLRHLSSVNRRADTRRFRPGSQHSFYLKAGYRTSEPEGAVGEKSLILEKVFKALRDEGISRSNVAEELLVPIEEIDAITFNVLPGGRLQNLSVLYSNNKILLKLVHSSDA